MEIGGQVMFPVYGGDVDEQIAEYVKLTTAEFEARLQAESEEWDRRIFSSVLDE